MHLKWAHINTSLGFNMYKGLKGLFKPGALQSSIVLKLPCLLACMFPSSKMNLLDRTNLAMVRRRSQFDPRNHSAH